LNSARLYTLQENLANRVPTWVFEAKRGGKINPKVLASNLDELEGK